ncbi:MAG: tetratricopeptide repeat protein [Myxococcales bacterium]|nr:tetratricopeptide repeat protein [Myxococcales bacterium]
MLKTSPKRTRRTSQARPKRPSSLKPAPREQRGLDKALPLEIDPRRVEETLARVKDQLVLWANKGRYTKVRFKFRGRKLLPDIPLAAVIAAEGLTFYWAGILRALLFNFAGQTVLDVELVNDSEKRIQRGKEELLSGELDRALECFREALAMDRDNPNVHLNLGIAHKLKGEHMAAREALERARALDREGPVGAEAERLLSSLPAAPAGGSAIATTRQPISG